MTTLVFGVEDLGKAGSQSTISFGHKASQSILIACSDSAITKKAGPFFVIVKGSIIRFQWE